MSSRRSSPLHRRRGTVVITAGSRSRSAASARSTSNRVAASRSARGEVRGDGPAMGRRRPVRERVLWKGDADDEAKIELRPRRRPRSRFPQGTGSSASSSRCRARRVLARRAARPARLPRENAPGRRRRARAAARRDRRARREREAAALKEEEDAARAEAPAAAPAAAGAPATAAAPAACRRRRARAATAPPSGLSLLPVRTQGAAAAESHPPRDLRRERRRPAGRATHVQARSTSRALAVGAPRAPEPARLAGAGTP